MYRTHLIYFDSNGCQDVWNTFYIFQFKQLSRCIEHILYISVQMIVKMYGTHIIYFSSNGCQDVWNTYYIISVQMVVKMYRTHFIYFSSNSCQDV